MIGTEIEVKEAEDKAQEYSSEGARHWPISPAYPSFNGQLRCSWVRSPAPARFKIDTHHMLSRLGENADAHVPASMCRCKIAFVA